MSRQHPATPAPTPPRVGRVVSEDLSEERLARASWAQFGSPWWFAARDRSDGPGRFDLVSPHGSCYFTDDPVGALIEKLTDSEDLDALISTATLDALVVWEGPVVGTDQIADFTARGSQVGKQLAAGSDYELGWQWADALHADGRSGIRWWLRLDPGPGRGVVVFGPTSAPEALPDPHHWPPLEMCTPAYAWRDELEAAFDIVEELPHLDELEVAPDH